VAAYPGADGAAIRAMVEAGAKGIVVHGYAYSGAPSDTQRNSLMEAHSAGVVVVQSSRGGGGRVPLWTPGHPHSPFLRADTLTATKARVLLMLALTKTEDAKELQRVFNQY
jgi:L-asparaginase